MNPIDRRTLLKRSAAALSLAAGAGSLGKAISLAQPATPTPSLATLGLPELAITVDDRGFTLPNGVVAGRTVLTVANKGANELHFFAARIPDDVSDADLASSMATPDVDPPWFDMTKLTLLGTPDWPRPSGQAQGVVDLTEGRWLFLDPIGGRDVAILPVGAGSDPATAKAPAADVEIGLVEMDFTGLDNPVRAGQTVWKISNHGALEHEIAILPVSPDATKEKVIAQIGDLLQGNGDPASFAPVAGQGIASRGVTSWQQFDLTPGRYAAVCMSPSADPSSDEPHAMMGMVRLFTVR
ncbi:MAG TPA: hypothetical protein VFQ80_06035 [Thermomicrobiales bacterium]|nr:hypothetical protein [Thermomicrobiales bacterium]